MTFQLLPLLERMKALYQIPFLEGRFPAYLQLLQGDTKGDLVLPIGGYNPMAKPHLLEKISELQSLQAEGLLDQTLQQINALKLLPDQKKNFNVSITISDDLLGGWTNRFTTDYDGRFKLNPLVGRQFCVAQLWSSEAYSPALICERVQTAVYRTIYWSMHPKPLTLEEQVAQEQFVARHTQYANALPQANWEQLENFYQEHRHTEDYSIIFNFLYGDHASQQLGFKTYGINDELAGVHYIRKSA